MLSHFTKLWILSVIFFSHPILSDQPPSWTEFQTVSSNKKFHAKIISLDTGKKDHQNSKFKLIVSRTNPKKSIVWESEFEYRFGYPGGILTNDGKYFIQVEVYYYPEISLIDIYKEGKKIPTQNLIGKNFSIPKSSLKSTSSHFLWFDQSNYYKFDHPDSPQKIIITTLDKNLHTIHLEKGELEN